MPEAPKFPAEVVLLHKDAKLPTRSRDTDAGWDVHAYGDYNIPSGRIETVRTGICLSVLYPYYFTTNPRSGLAFHHDIWLVRGTVDATYTGELRIRIHNKSDHTFYIQTGDRIAQLSFHKVYEPEFTVVNEFSPEYDVRGTAGFGSSGK